MPGPSCALLPGLVDETRKPFQFVVGQFGARIVQERRDGLRGGAFEERVQHVFHRRPLRLVPRDGWDEHVAWAVLYVADVTLFLQHPQHRAHGGIAGRLGNLSHDVRRGRLSLLKQNIHDLTFAPAQVRMNGLDHRLESFSEDAKKVALLSQAVKQKMLFF